MSQHRTKIGWIIGLAGLALLLFLLSLAIGSVSIPFKGLLQSISGTAENETWSTILWNIRWPRAITALLAGIALSLSGLMMQTLFRNPIAGPFVLGISSGASLGAALLIMSSGIFGVSAVLNPFSSWHLAISALLGALLVLLLVLAASFRVRDIATLLIIGLMVGSTTGALVTILQYYSDQESLKRFVLWSFGNLGAVTNSELKILAGVVLAGVVWTLSLTKALNGLMIGEEYARSLGLNVQSARLQLIGATALMTGTLTAFCGPIAFVGIAVPHLTRMAFKTQHHLLLVPACVVVGSSVMLFCDLVTRLPFTESQLPINAVTSLMGAPLVIWIVLRRKRIG